MLKSAQCRPCRQRPFITMRMPAILLFLALAGMLHAADPAGAFRPWSAVDKFDVEKLARGKIATECNGSMNFARGISAQAVFIVAAPPESALRALLASDPTKRAGQETYQRIAFHTVQDAGFAKLKLDPRIPSVRRFLEMMGKREDLHLFRAEIAQLPKGDSIEDAQRFLAGTMTQRWTQWTQRGELRVTESFDVRAEIAGLLKDEPKLAQRFASLLAPFTQTGTPAVPVQHYWDLSSVNHTAAICLGTIYTRAADGRQQVLDVTYYASSGYLTSITLYEMLPITLEGQPRTLVWEACLVSAPALAGGFGVKKAVGSRLMVGDLEKSVRFFQQDAAAAQ